MSEKKETVEKDVKKEVKKKPVKKIPSKKYPLIKEVTIGGIVREKGFMQELTEKGYKDFKQKKYIK